MRECYIYKMTNPKGAVYIGSTINLKDRIYRYKSLRCKQQVKIYNSLKKYGFENHNFEIVTTCNIEDIYKLEHYYGIVYDVLSEKNLNLKLPKVDDVFNCTSIETRKKIGLAHKGKKISDEQKVIISINSKKWHENNVNPMKGATPWNKGKKFLAGKKNPMYGVKRSKEWKEEHRIRMNKIKKVGANHPRSKKVIDLYVGIIYDSAKEVSVAYNIVYSTLKERIRKKINYRFKYI